MSRGSVIGGAGATQMPRLAESMIFKYPYLSLLTLFTHILLGNIYVWCQAVMSSVTLYKLYDLSMVSSLRLLDFRLGSATCSI